MPESTPAEGRPSGPMRSLSPAQRRQWQEETLHSPRLRYGIPAREWDAVPFSSLAAPEYGRYDSLADVLRQIGDDEGVHKRISLDRLTRAR